MELYLQLCLDKISERRSAVFSYMLLGKWAETYTMPQCYKKTRPTGGGR